MLRRLILVSIFLASIANQVNAVDLRSGVDAYNPVPTMHFYLDEEANLKAVEAKSKLEAAPILNKQVANFGMTKKTYWFMFDLNNIDHPEDTWYIGVNYPLLDFIELHDYHDGREESYVLGDREPFSKRVIKNRNHIFVLKVNPGSEHKIVIRIQTDGSLEVPIAIETPAFFHHEDHVSQLLWGIYVGCLLIMLIYYLLISIGTRNIEYVLMANFFAATLLFRLSLHGYLTEYIFPDSMIGFANQSVVFFTGNLFFSGVLYSYFHLPVKNYPITRIPTLFCITLFGILISIAFFVPYNFIKVITSCSMLVCLTMVFNAAYLHFKKRYKPAKYFMLGWTALLISGILYALQKLGAVPHSQVVSASVEVSILIMVMALSIGQTVKINDLAKQLQTSLESQVAERTKQLEEKSANIRGMLDNIDEAIFTIENSAGAVGAEKSKQCQKILEQDIANVSQFVGRLQESDDRKAIIMQSINASVLETEISFEINREHLPSRVRYEAAEDRVKVLDCSYQAIVDSIGYVRHILVAIKDVTRQLELEAESFKRNVEQKMISDIVQNRDQNFANNLMIIKSLGQEAATQYENRKEANSAEILRTIHTIKGNSRAVGLSYVATCCHTLEGELAKPMPQEYVIREMVVDLGKTINKYIDIFENKLGFKQETSQAASFDPKWLRAQFEQLKQGLISQEFLDRVREVVQVNIGQLLRPLVHGLEKIAVDLNKPMPEVQFGGNLDFDIPKEHHAALINAMNHLLRNSLDHGIEEPGIRKEKGKNPKGTISIDVTTGPGFYEICQSDDGQGFDLDKIKKLANKFTTRNLNELSPEELLFNTVFLSRFTTRDIVSEVSGRGIGLDAVKSLVEKANGSIKLDCKQIGNIAYVGICLRMPC